jgi:hypothetical protein
VKTLKRIILGTVIVFVVLVCAAGVFTSLKKDQIATVVLDKFNNYIDTKISYSSLRINLWSAFPDVSATFNNILIRPSAGYAKKEFVKEDSDTLLFASHLSVSVDMFSLLTGKTVIKGISVRNGVANLLTDSRGNTNFRVFSEDDEKASGSNVKLSNLSARGMKVRYYDRQSDVNIKGSVDNSSLDGEILGSGIDLTADVSLLLDKSEIYGFTLPEAQAYARITLFKTNTSVNFREGSLKMGDLIFSITGTTDYRNKWLDLTMKGQDIDISDISSSLPPQYAEYLAGIKPGGKMAVSCFIKGPYGSKGTPHFDISYDLKKGRLVHDQSGIDVNNLTLRGRITNGVKNSRKTFALSIDTLSAALGAAYFNGSFRLENADNPFVRVSLNGDLVFNDLRKYIKTKSFDSREGAISGNLRMKGYLPSGKKFSFADITQLNPNANLQLADFGADFPDLGLSFNNVSGKIRLTDELRVEDLCMTILGQKYCFNCVLGNFTDWITGGGAMLDVTGDISADIFIPSAFAATQKKNTEKNSENKSVSIFPSDVKAYINFHADSLINKDFHARNFNATLSYKPFVVSFNNLTAECLDGSISGDMLAGLRSDGTYLAKGAFNLNSINIQKSFDSFHNFGQKFIVGKNLAGSISGNVSVLYQMDKNFNINYPSLIGEAHAVVVDGKLIDFKPVEELSKFIELDELKNISFSKMENDLFVRNSTLTIPKMEITSSVGWFSLYGNHYFSGDYTYHIRVLLSEILSKKAKKQNSDNSEFGRVAEDEGNKITIPLKIESKNGKFTSAYDFGQSRQIVKENVVEEKKNLKGILNEEYGWYKSDSTANHKEQATKPKFKIEWEEGKEQVQEKSDTADNTSLRNIFRKKK